MALLFLTVSLFHGSINSDVFYAWPTVDFLPKVEPQTVVVLDNATFHRRNDMIEAMRSNGCIVEFLPPYSPDFNPIEHKWAQAKAYRRKTHCSVDELFKNYDKI